MKKLLAVFILCAVALYGCQANTQVSTNLTDITDENRGASDTATSVFFGVTDAAADMESVSEVTITVDAVEVQSQDEAWTELNVEQTEFNLLELNASQTTELLAQADLDPGTYNQVRLDVSQVLVTDQEGQKEAKLPSNTLRINGELVIEENTTSSAVFDFQADQSLHVTGNGQYIMTPVIAYETRSGADVSVNADNTVTIRGGQTRAEVTLGMNADGNMGVGVQAVPGQAQVSVSNGNIQIGAGADIRSATDLPTGNSNASGGGDAAIGLGLR